MVIKSTGSLLNVEGANEKELMNIDGKLCVVKRNLQENCYDAYAEAMIFKLAEVLGVSCCEAGFIVELNSSYSVVDRAIRSYLVSADEFLGISNPSFQSVWKSLLSLGINKGTLTDYLRQTLFDILTRQLDRNLTNFNFIVQSEDKTLARLYPLFDNGLSLFSTTKLTKDTTFRSISGESSDYILIKAIARSKELELSYSDFFAFKLNKDELTNLWADFPEVFINGNLKNDIIDWIINQQQIIFDKFKMI